MEGPTEIVSHMEACDVDAMRCLMAKGDRNYSLGRVLVCALTLAAILLFDAVWPYNAHAQEVNAASADGAAYAAGDINGDGSVNNKDLSRLFQHLSDWDVEVVEENLDTNGDGSVNNKDLTRLFQHLTGWDVELHGGTATPVEPDPIEVEIATEEVEFGANALFKCIVKNAGDKALTYQWQESTDGIEWADLKGQSQSSTSIKASSDTLSLQYRCVVTREAGEPLYSEAKAMRVSGDLPKLQVAAHVKNLSWLNYVDAGEIAGTTGRDLRLEALKIKLVDGSGTSVIRYRVHSADVGWSSWKSSDEIAGTTGRNLQAEAFAVELTGDFANLYDVYYRAHVSDVGWIGWAKNGEVAGSVGLSKSIEAVQVILKNKGDSFDVGAAHELVKPELKYCAHVEGLNWQDVVAEGKVAGTTGKNLRMEALKVYMPDVYGSGNAVVVRAHCSDIGWQGWVGNGQVAGTTGQSRQIECVQINLSGYAVGFFDIYYRAHIMDYGWLGWAKNGEMAGSTNGAKRMEAIEIRLVVKGESFDTGSNASYMDLTSQVSGARGEAVAYLRSLVGQNCCWHDSTTDCVDVAQYYYDWLGVGARSGNGCAYHTGNLPAGWTRIYSDPLPGDVAAWGSSWGSSGYGHVACVVEVNGNNITVVEQSTTKRKNAGHNIPCYYKTYSVSSPYSYLRPNF